MWCFYVCKRQSKNLWYHYKGSYCTWSQMLWPIRTAKWMKVWLNIEGLHRISMALCSKLEHDPIPSTAGFRVRWKKVSGGLAPSRFTFCRSRVGFWSCPSHSIISWHSGIHWPGSNWSASFLKIWSPLLQNISMTLISALLGCWRCGWRDWNLPLPGLPSLRLWSSLGRSNLHNNSERDITYESLVLFGLLVFYFSLQNYF